MIKVKYPLEHRNQQQEALLTIALATQEPRRFHWLLYSYCNAIVRYDGEYRNIPPCERDDGEWLEGLHPAIAENCPPKASKCAIRSLASPDS